MPAREPRPPHDLIALDALTTAVASHADGEGLHATRVPGLRLGRSSAPTPLLFQLQQPSIHVDLQGRKEVLFGERRIAFDRAHYLAAAVDVIAAARIVEATPTRPYLAISFDLSAATLGALVAEFGGAIPQEPSDALALFVTRLDASLIDALLRLVRLLDTPDDIAVMAPLIGREIHYRLLRGEQGARLAQMAIGGSRTQRIARAVDWLKNNLSATLRIDALARALHVSPSTLHHQFKAVTAMSPLQFQKRLRLHEGRRLMLVEGHDVTRAAFDVGYDSASHFIREYARVYGAPPLRDVKRLRATFAAR